MNKQLLILDIDGTIADLSHREQIIDEKQEPTKKDWDKFFSPELVEKDQPIQEAKKILDIYLDKFDKVIFLTGRPESLRKTTKDWLKENFGLDISDSDLYMRPNENAMPSSSLKKAIINQKIKPKYKEYDWTFVDDEDDNLEVFQEFGEALKAPDHWAHILNTGDINVHAKTAQKDYSKDLEKEVESYCEKHDVYEDYCSPESFKEYIKIRGIPRLAFSENLSEEFLRYFFDSFSSLGKFQIVTSQKLSESFMRDFQDKLDWSAISNFQRLSEDFIREFKNKVDWKNISTYQKLSEDFIREFQDYVYWDIIASKQNLSENFIREFEDKFIKSNSWNKILYSQKLSEEFIRKEIEEAINTYKISPGAAIPLLISIIKKHPLSENLISYIFDNIYDAGIEASVSHYQDLSEDFIRRYKDKLSWTGISLTQDISEDFIREFQNKVDWKRISERTIPNINERFSIQKASGEQIPAIEFTPEFLIEFKDDIKWNIVLENQKLDDNTLTYLAEAYYEQTAGQVPIFGAHEWSKLAEYQHLSEDFILRFMEYLDPEAILTNQNHISREFLNKLYVNNASNIDKIVSVAQEIEEGSISYADIGTLFYELNAIEKEYLNSVLPPQFNIVEGERYYYDENINEYVEEVLLRKRNINPENGTWLHVVNKTIDDPVQFVNNFMGITGEVCFSDTEDFHLHTRKKFFAIVVEGPAISVFDDDVWSNIDLLGRRILGPREGSTRTEAWVVPAQTEFQAVVTDIEEWKDILEQNGIAVYFLSPKTLRPPREEDEDPEELQKWEEYEDIYEEVEERGRWHANKINLSEKAFEKFVNSIENPPKPNENLKKAAENYKKQANSLKSVQPEDLMEVVDPEIFYKVKNRIAENINPDGTITLYRALQVPGDPETFVEHLTEGEKELGIFWSYDKNFAIPYWSSESSGDSVVLQGKVNEQDIDWEDNLSRNLALELYESPEHEIRLTNNTPIQLEALWVGDAPIDISFLSGKSFRASLYNPKRLKKIAKNLPPIEKWNQDLQKIMGRDISFQPTEVQRFQPEALKKKAKSYWKEGESLVSQGYPQSHVQIYRALPATTAMIDDEDFVTLNRQFAKDHAVTSAVYNEEPFYVVRKLVPAENVVGASNPDEYKWIGGSFKGDPIYLATPDGEIQYLRYGKRKKAMAFEALPPEKTPSFGVDTHPGFHTTESFDIAASYAISKVYEFHTEEDPDGVWYVDDYPVVVSLDMRGLQKELDYDAINFVSDSLTTALDEFGRYVDIEEMSDEELVRKLESFGEGYGREVRIDSPLDAIGEQSFSHFETPIYPLLNLPNTAEVVREYFRTGDIPAEVLMKVTDQYRYTTDVEEQRLKSVHYVKPVAKEISGYENEEKVEDAFPGFNVLWEDDVYSGMVDFESQVVWEGDLGDILYPGQMSFPFAENVEPEIEYHGTTYNRLLQAVPQLATVLPKPPTPPYRESGKQAHRKRKQGINTYYDIRPDYTIEEIIHKWLRDGDKLKDDINHGKFSIEEILKYTREDHRRDNARLSEEEWDSLAKDMDSGWDEERPAIMSIYGDGRAYLNEGNHRVQIAHDLWCSDPITYAHLEEVPVKFVFWQGYIESPEKLQKEQEDIEKSLLEQNSLDFEE